MCLAAGDSAGGTINSKAMQRIIQQTHCSGAVSAQYTRKRNPMAGLAVGKQDQLELVLEGRN